MDAEGFESAELPVSRARNASDRAGNRVETTNQRSGKHREREKQENKKNKKKGGGGKRKMYPGPRTCRAGTQERSSEPEPKKRFRMRALSESGVPSTEGNDMFKPRTNDNMFPAGPDTHTHVSCHTLPFPHTSVEADAASQTAPTQHAHL
eukprot:2691711-Rhodomonas_salina.2